MTETPSPPDLREAFRDRFLDARQENGKYEYTGQARALLNAIAGYVKPDSGEFYMSQKNAARLLGCDERYVRRILERVRRDRLIEVVSRGNGDRGGGSRATRFRVITELQGNSDPLDASNYRVNSADLEGQTRRSRGSNGPNNRAPMTPLSSSNGVQRSSNYGRAARSAGAPRTPSPVVGILVDESDPSVGHTVYEVHCPRAWHTDLIDYLWSCKTRDLHLIYVSVVDGTVCVRVPPRCEDEWRALVATWLAERGGVQPAQTKRDLAAMKRRAAA